MKINSATEVHVLVLHAMVKYTDDYKCHKTTTGSELLTLVFEDGDTYNITITKARKCTTQSEG